MWTEKTLNTVEQLKSPISKQPDIQSMELWNQHESHIIFQRYIFALKTKTNF